MKHTFKSGSVHGPLVLEVRGDFCKLGHEDDEDPWKIYFRLSHAHLIECNQCANVDFTAYQDDSYTFEAKDGSYGCVSFVGKENLDNFLKAIKEMQ